MAALLELCLDRQQCKPMWAQPSNNFPDRHQDPFLTWQGLLLVDGKPYEWLGDWKDGGTTPAPVAAANLTRFSVTPTRTIFEMQAGPMSVNVTFLSPIEASMACRPYTGKGLTAHLAL